MREIKFRAWDRGEKRMIYEALGITNLGFGNGSVYVDERVQNGDELDWMQYTGLKDKNGKEIYEGDIFKHTTHDSIEVVAWDDYYGGYKMPNSFDEECMYYLGDIDGIEVIGNIYENPELLTKK